MAEVVALEVMAAAWSKVSARSLETESTDAWHSVSITSVRNTERCSPSRLNVRA